MSRLSILIVLVSCVLWLGGAPASSTPLRLCKDQFVRDRSLYVQTDYRGVRCWVQVQEMPSVHEGSRTATNLPALSPRGTAKFAYVIGQSVEAPTVVVVKERIMKLEPDSLGRPAPVAYAYPDNDVVLIRPPVSQNSCGDRLDYYAPAAGTRAGLMNLGQYNRYHEQTPLLGIPNVIPRSDQLRNFHFKYPVADRQKLDCRDTDDGATGNRREFAFRGLSAEPDSWLSATFSGKAFASNNFYKKLRVQNLYVNSDSRIQDAAQSSEKYYVASFTATADEYTRTELTISNLERYRDGVHWPTTWQMDWLKPKVSTAR